jgi:hypothetical protein
MYNMLVSILGVILALGKKLNSVTLLAIGITTVSPRHIVSGLGGGIVSTGAVVICTVNCMVSLR